MGPREDKVLLVQLPLYCGPWVPHHIQPTHWFMGPDTIPGRPRVISWTPLRVPTSDGDGVESLSEMVFL